MPLQKIVSRQCIICGEKFGARSRQAIYCYDCKDESRMQKMRAASKRKHRDVKNNYKLDEFGPDQELRPIATLR